ncbi:27070_t:CDS:2 [Gigaspora margarita]|uniref:27070_t:CDS:1 n=1 Tax=Gigaspora margarita TaxID=4874 RepID=A0ABN7VK86_GIGMA|nr:27070_t:CDS:2 [Gigaspora margarita]
MIIEKLFQKYRKTEPTSLFVLKNFVLISLLIALLGYTWIIIWGIYNDNPIIQNSLAEETYIPAPYIQFTATQKTNISCHFVNISGAHDCNGYVFPYINNAGKTGVVETYSEYFVKEDLKFSTTTNNGINFLEFKIYLNDTSFNLSDSKSAPLIVLDLQDLDYAKQRRTLLSNQLPTYSQLPKSLAGLNLYALASFYVNIYKICLALKTIMDLL